MFYYHLQEVCSAHLPQERPAEKGKFPLDTLHTQHGVRCCVPTCSQPLATERCTMHTLVLINTARIATSSCLWTVITTISSSITSYLASVCSRSRQFLLKKIFLPFQRPSNTPSFSLCTHMGTNGRAGKLCHHLNNGGIPIEPICNVLSHKDVLKYLWSIRIIQNFEECNENRWFKKSILLKTTDFLINIAIVFPPIIISSWLILDWKKCLLLVFGAEIASCVCANPGKGAVFLFGISEWHCEW